MNVGMIGLGKLGLPCLLAMERYGGNKVYGVDKSNAVVNAIRLREVSYWEEGVNDLLSESSLEVLNSIDELVNICDVIFVAVETPHDPNFEGRTEVPDERKDFDYSALEAVAASLAAGLLTHPDRNPLIVVISTVLPGTMRDRILPILQGTRISVRFAYNPYFIAMGTTIHDFLNPEFILAGTLTSSDAQALHDFYSFIDRPVIDMSVESAELTKVAYNTYIGFKIVFANSIAEIVSARGGDADEVTDALARADNRLMSGAYMKAGMGDGGGCHPRDQIAMSWLAREAALSVDIFDFIARARDSQTRRQAEIIISEAGLTGLPICLLGMSYKPNCPLDIGSPARLLETILRDMGVSVATFDPWMSESQSELLEAPHVFFISSRHDSFKDVQLPAGSTVIDPWGYRLEQPGVTLLRPGRSKGALHR